MRGLAQRPIATGGLTRLDDELRLRNIQRAVRDGLCTSSIEDLALEKVGGPTASTYGELTPYGMNELGSALRLGPADVFCDLGSGLGRLVVQAVRDFGVIHSCGVEFMVSRHRLAEAEIERADGAAPLIGLRRRITLIHGDCADAELWRDHDLAGRVTCAFASNLLFDGQLNERLRQRLEEAGPTLRAVASLKEWPGGLAGFEAAQLVRCETSWSAKLLLVDGAGSPRPHEGSPVYIYERSRHGDGGSA